LYLTYNEIMEKKYPKEYSMKRNFLISLALFALLLSACNMPTSPGAQPNDPNAIFTVAAQTVEAQLTESAFFNTPTPPFELASATPDLPLVLASNTPLPATPTSTPICDLAQFVSDVTIPDGAEVQPGQTFTKTWRLRNMGVCSWNTSYALVFESGEAMSGDPVQNLAGNVAAGESVDVSITLKAPTTPGTYRGYWRIRNAAGVLMPVLSGYQGKSFFVEIKVPAPTATPTPSPTITNTPFILIPPPTFIIILPSATPTP
jgi:hypothetical protein